MKSFQIRTGKNSVFGHFSCSVGFDNFQWGMNSSTNLMKFGVNRMLTASLMQGGWMNPEITDIRYKTIWYCFLPHPSTNPPPDQTCAENKRKYLCSYINFRKRSRTSILETINMKNEINPAGISCSKSTVKTLEHANGAILVSLLLTLNIFHTLFQCLYC